MTMTTRDDGESCLQPTVQDAPPAQAGSDACIVRAHGGGGELMGRLISEHILAALGNDTLNDLTDGAVLQSDTERIVMTTDSFVVQPLEFPGGDIGHLAVCGTVNDLAVMGGRPLGLSLGLIVEEGLPLATLDRVLASIAAAAREAGVNIVTGDTKVIEHGRGDGLYINTAGVAALDSRTHLGMAYVEAGDAILINGTLGDHGMAVMSVRNGLEFDTTIQSDAAPLNHLITDLFEAGVAVHFMRDATRGGLAGVLADVAERTELGIDIHEDKLPLNQTTKAAAEMLGFDLLTVANEGKLVMTVSQADAELALAVLKQSPYGRQASIIGRVTSKDYPLVELITTSGGRRVVQRPYGEDLPRIC